MQKNNKFLDDLSKMASSATGTLLEMKREMEAAMGVQMEKMVKKMDLVTREEYNLVREMAVKARTEQEMLAKRIAELENQLKKSATSKPAAKKTPPSKSSSKKS